MGKLIDADNLLTDLKDKKKSLRESLNFAKREGETKWADELREQMQILTQIIDGVEHGGYAPNPIPLPTIKPGDKVKYKRNSNYGVGEVKGIDAFVKFENMDFTTRVSPDDLEVSHD